MRLALATCAALTLASAAEAQSVQDRYGPPRTTAPAAPASPQAAPAQEAASKTEPATHANYNGPMLGWSNKRQAPPPQAAAPIPQAEPPRQATAPQPPAIAASRLVVPTQAVQASAQPTVPAPAKPAAPPAPPPQPAAPALAKAAPAPAAPKPAAAPKVASAEPAPAAGAPRMYSVHRQYGIHPDAIPRPPAGSSYVLIGPSETEAPAEDAPKSEPGALSDPQF